MVAGSELYQISIKIDKMPTKAWKQLCEQCTSSVTSTIDLLRGKLPEPIISTLTDPDSGLFPRSRQIHLSCDCPDWAGLCKHLAAVLYGVGNRLDDSPELLFLLRGVDQNDLIGSSLIEATEASVDLGGAPGLDSSELGDIFGIDLIDSPKSTKPRKSKQQVIVKKKAAKKKTAKKKVANKKPASPKGAKKKVPKKKAATKKAAGKKAAPKKAKPATKKATKRKTRTPKKRSQ